MALHLETQLAVPQWELPGAVGFKAKEYSMVRQMLSVSVSHEPLEKPPPEAPNASLWEIPHRLLVLCG